MKRINHDPKKMLNLPIVFFMRKKIILNVYHRQYILWVFTYRYWVPLINNPNWIVIVIYWNSITARRIYKYILMVPDLYGVKNKPLLIARFGNTLLNRIIYLSFRRVIIMYVSKNSKRRYYFPIKFVKSKSIIIILRLY